MAGYSAREPFDQLHLCPPGWPSWEAYAAKRLERDPEVAESFPDAMSDNVVDAVEDTRAGQHGRYSRTMRPPNPSTLEDPWLLQEVRW